MTKERERLEELKELIKKYDVQYYELNESEISDSEYDLLYQEYQQLEAKIGVIDNSPTSRVGAGDVAGATTGLPKYTHKTPLLSIDKKSKELSELKDWYQKMGGDGTIVTIQPKLDGITCNINYEEGRFVNAATRGNGYIGELITENFLNSNTYIPLTLKSEMDLEVRGEAIIPYDFFKEKLSDKYSNPRNAVSGIMRNLEPIIVKDKGVQVLFYDLGIVSEELNTDSDNERTSLCIEGKQIPGLKTLIAKDWESLSKIIDSKMNGLIQEVDGFNVLIDIDKKNPQAICDGLVIKIDSISRRDSIGFSSKGPKWMFAFKFKALEVETTIREVTWQVGKSGRLTPVGIFDEANIGGTKITRATLNNYDYIKSMNLEMDDSIILQRSNDVIPKIVGVAKKQSFIYQQDVNTTAEVERRKHTFDLPKECPVCGGPILDKYPLHYCSNKNCPAVLKGRIEHYASRNAMNIVGLGEGIIDSLEAAGFIIHLESIYTLKDKRAEMLQLEGFKDKKVDNLLASIEKSKDCELFQFIYALSIPGVGISTAKDLSKKYKTLDNFLLATKEELLDMDDIAEIMANQIIEFLDNTGSKEMIQSLIQSGVSPKEVKSNGDSLKGKTFVITGTLKSSRKYYADIIESLGGTVSGSVSKKTYAVLIGEDAGSKEQKARDLASKGIDILLLDTEDKIAEVLQ